MRMGLREANQHFSQLMKIVRQGREVILTERGKPLAVIKSIAADNGPEKLIERLAGAGVLRPAAKRRRLPAWTPRKMKGRSLSATLREERDAR